LKEVFSGTLQEMLEAEKVRSDSKVVNKVAYIIIGIDIHGMKDVLGI